MVHGCLFSCQSSNSIAVANKLDSLDNTFTEQQKKRAAEIEKMGEEGVKEYMGKYADGPIDEQRSRNTTATLPKLRVLMTSVLAALLWLRVFMISLPFF